MITVPPATETGTKVRLRGPGRAGRAGGPPGDLLVTFQVQPDRFFHREGLDIVCEVPINLAQAALGTRLRVRTLDGKKVMLRIPAGTQPGASSGSRGRGWRRAAPGRPAGADAGRRAREAHAGAGGAAEEVRANRRGWGY